MADTVPLPSLLQLVMRRFFRCLQQRQKDNYDACRFSADGIDRSEIFDVAYHTKNLCFFISNHQRLGEAWNLLVDPYSRGLFVDVILWRLAGHLHVKLRTNNPRYRKVMERVARWPGVPSGVPHVGLFGALEHFRLKFGGEVVQLDMWRGNLAAFQLRQYFLERGSVRIVPHTADHVIDAGSLFGDTAVAFAIAIGAQGRVYTFDPVGAHGDVVRQNIGQNHLEQRVRFFPVALGARNNDVLAAGSANAENHINPGFDLTRLEPADSVQIRSIDSLIATGEVERCDFLKMDIEGSELAALRGAEQTLRKFKPRLAISLYHNFEDLFEIPFFIHNLGLGYRFYLAHYSIHVEETVLYGDPSP